ncbi:MAG: DUF58 domain-containing protein [Eubacterium sp.]|nr:DUF58 domain-containing protein [Eubacterium sp.]
MKKAVPILLLISLLILNFIESNKASQAILFAFVLMMIISLCIALVVKKRLSAKLFVTASGRVDKTAKGRLEINNESHIPVVSLNIRILTRNLYTEEKELKCFSVAIGAKEKRVIELEIGSEHCGKIKCELEGMSVGWFLGFFDIKCKTNAHSTFTILPEIFDVAILYDLKESDSFDNEVYSQFKKGKDLSETFQIREYADGDSLKQIHWKLSSKLDKLIVRDASLPLDKELMVFVDKSLSREATAAHKEALAELALSTCQSLIDEELEFALVWNSPDENLVEVRSVQFAEDMVDAIPQIIGSPAKLSKTSCGDTYISMHGNCKATHVIYISIGPAQNSYELTNGKIVFIDASNEIYRENGCEMILY